MAEPKIDSILNRLCCILLSFRRSPKCTPLLPFRHGVATLTGRKPNIKWSNQDRYLVWEKEEDAVATTMAAATEPSSIIRDPVETNVSKEVGDNIQSPNVSMKDQGENLSLRKKSNGKHESGTSVNISSPKITRYYAVFDGHGAEGDKVSSKCIAALPKILDKCNDDFDLTFDRMQTHLEDVDDTDSSRSGSTCTILIVREDEGKIEIANAGDSCAILVSRNDCDISQTKYDKKSTSGIYCYTRLTALHTPANKDEAARIRKGGGEVYSRKGKKTEIGKEKNEKENTRDMMVWYKNINTTDVPTGRRRSSTSMGLAMTRSLGDLFAHNIGVSHKPHIVQRLIEPNDEYILIASDGLWDVLNYKTAIDEVESIINMLHMTDDSFSGGADAKNLWNPQEVVDILIRRARRVWESKNFYVDDITCILIRFCSNEVGACKVGSC